MIVVGVLRETGVFEFLIADVLACKISGMRRGGGGSNAAASSSPDAAFWTYIGLAPARREGGRPGPDGQPRTARTKRRCWRRS